MLCLNKFKVFLFIILCIFSIADAKNALFWWNPADGTNFGDDLSRVVVSKIIGRPAQYGSLKSNEKIMMGVGSIIHFSRPGDVIWGSGFREGQANENRYHKLDIRAVRGPKTRNEFLKIGVPCPEVYGDPALLLCHLFPEYKRQTPVHNYIIIPNIGEINCFIPYKNVVLPTRPWEEVLQEMLKSKLVIASSLHGVIMAESYGIPARLLKMTWVEPLFKYEDYYQATGRADFKYATSVRQAIEMGGEKPGVIDLNPLLQAFPCDHFD
jgi:pyruvyltransferase